MLSDLISQGIDIHSYIEAVSTSRQTTAKLETTRPPYVIPAYLSEHPDLFAQITAHNHSVLENRGDTCGTMQHLNHETQTQTQTQTQIQTQKETTNARSERESDATAAAGVPSMMLGGDATGLHVQKCTNGFTVVTLKGTCDDLPRKWPPDGAHSPGCTLPVEAAAAAQWSGQNQGGAGRDDTARNPSKRPVLISSFWAPSGQSEACPNQSCVEQCSDQCVWADAHAAEACALSGYADLVLHTTESKSKWKAAVKPQRQVWAATLTDSDSVQGRWKDSEPETMDPFDFVVHNGTFPGIFRQPMDACKLCEYVSMRVAARCASPPRTFPAEKTPPHVLIMFPQSGHQIRDSKFIFRTQGFEVGVDGHVVVQLVGKHEYTAVVTIHDQNDTDLVYSVAEGVLQWTLPFAELGDAHTYLHNTRIHTYIDTYLHTHTHTYIHACMHTHIHTIHTYLHTHTHT